MNLASKLRSFLFDASAKKYWLALGLILAVAGQSLIREPQPLSSFKTITNYLIGWNETFRLSLTNPINILVGLFLIMMAVFIHSRLFISTGGLPGPFTPSWDRSFWKKYLPWVAVSLCGYALVMIERLFNQA